MTTCPRCGRVADDEFVCADCGAFLAGGGDAGPAPAVSIRRVALLVLVVCLLGAGAAVLLLSGGGGHRTGAGAPLISGSAERSTTPPSAGGGSSTSPATHAPGPRPRSSAGASTSRSRTATSSPTPTRTRATRPAQSSATPRPSSTAPRRSNPPPARSVQLGQSSSGTCGPHCHTLTVTLSNFSTGAHHVSCFDEHGRQFAAYTTSATTSSGCSYDRPHASVYVVVGGTRSNTVSW